MKGRDDAALFGYAVGPHSWKQFLHPPVLPLWRAEKRDAAFTIVGASDSLARFAFVGVRCSPHSTHGIGLAETVELARILGRLPHPCVLYAIEGQCYDIGVRLSPSRKSGGKSGPVRLG